MAATHLIKNISVNLQKQFAQRCLTFFSDTHYPWTLAKGEEILKRKEKSHPPICPSGRDKKWERRKGIRMSPRAVTVQSKETEGYRHESASWEVPPVVMVYCNSCSEPKKSSTVSEALGPGQKINHHHYPPQICHDWRVCFLSPGCFDNASFCVSPPHHSVLAFS